MMGVYTVFIVIIGIYFPKFAIKGYVRECDPEDYITVYFYDGYVNGLCKVTRLYGDPNYPDNMERMYSFIDSKGKYITDKWFYAVGGFENNRCIVAIDDYQFNIINTKGAFVCKHDYNGMSLEMMEGKVKVSDGKGGINFVDVKTGDELWDEFKKEMCYVPDKQ